MAENYPNVPPGAVPPKPAEAAKVQPKKETVRINLPPKPSASPTIKLPTLPSGGPPRPGTIAPAAAMAAPSATPAAPRPGPTVAPAAVPAARAAAPTASSARPATAAPAPLPRSMAVVGISGLDKGLIVAAMITSLIALASVSYLIWLLPDTAK